MNYFDYKTRLTNNRSINQYFHLKLLHPFFICLLFFGLSILLVSALPAIAQPDSSVESPMSNPTILSSSNSSQDTTGATPTSTPTNEFKKFYNEGVQLLKEGNYEGALQSFDKATKINPSKANAWHNKGLTYDKLNRYDEAISAYDIATFLDPANAATWNAKGTTLFNKGLYNESLTSYDKAIKLEPANTEYQNNKQIVLKKLSATPIDSSQQTSPFEISTIPKGDVQEAVNANGINTQAEEPSFYHNKGDALRKQGKYDEAIKYYDKALAIDPYHKPSLNSKGIALAKQGKYDEAISYYEKALAIDPGDTNAIKNKDSALKKLDRSD